jgi:TolB protein
MTARRSIGLPFCGLLLAGAAVETVQATPPGTNGSIAFRRYLGPDRTHGAIFTIAADGSGERQVTRPPADASDDFPDVAANGSSIAFQRCGSTRCALTARACAA